MEGSFTVIITIAVTTRVPLNKKGAYLFIKRIFEPEQSVCVEIGKLLSNYKNIMVLLTLLTTVDLNRNDFYRKIKEHRLFVF